MSVKVQFSPPAGIPAAIKGCIDQTKRHIQACIYNLTESTICDALGNAVGRGVLVELILDYKGVYKSESLAWEAARRGVHVYTDDHHSQLHTKYAIWDDGEICDGSANWSYNADGFSAESWLYFEHEHNLALQYVADWQTHRNHAIALPRS